MPKKEPLPEFATTADFYRFVEDQVRNARFKTDHKDRYILPYQILERAITAFIHENPKAASGIKITEIMASYLRERGYSPMNLATFCQKVVPLFRAIRGTTGWGAHNAPRARKKRQSTVGFKLNTGSGATGGEFAHLRQVFANFRRKKAAKGKSVDPPSIFQRRARRG